VLRHNKITRKGNIIEIFGIIDKLESLATSGIRVPMSKKLFVDSETLLELVDQLRVSIPQDISTANEVIRKREELLNQSLGEAKRIRASAETEFRSKVGETELVKEAGKEAKAISKEAEERAQQILDVAETQAATKRTSADRYAQEQLYKLEEEVNRLLSTVRNGIEVLEAQQKVSGQ
jgi:hypothetical protein